MINLVWVKWSFNHGRRGRNDFGNLRHLLFFEDFVSYGCDLEMLDTNCELPGDTLDFDMVDVDLFPFPSLQKMFPPSPKDLHTAKISYPILMQVGIATAN